MIHWFIAALLLDHARRFLGDARHSPVPGGIAVIELGTAGDFGPDASFNDLPQPVIRHKGQVGGAGRAAARCRRGDLHAEDPLGGGSARYRSPSGKNNFRRSVCASPTTAW